jgi:ketosteroid isomerase-like protein
MVYGRAALGVAAVLCCWGVCAAQGQELATLRASFEAEIDALNRRDLTATLAPLDERVVLCGIFSPFPIAGREGVRQAVQEYFAEYEHAVFTPIDPEFRVVGTTGVAWGNFRLATRRKGGPSAYADGRYMFTYAPADGRWVLTSMHYSLLGPLVR